MKQHKWVLISLILVLVAAFMAWNLFVSERARRQAMERDATRPIDLESTLSEDPGLGTVDLVLYFPNPAGMPGETDFLIVETRSAPLLEGVTLRARQIVQEVLKGPRPAQTEGLEPAPAGTAVEGRLRQLYLLEGQTAVVDLHTPGPGVLPGGVAAEYGMLLAVTRSLRANLPEITQVRFLVEGADPPTFAGHVSLDQPFD